MTVNGVLTYDDVTNIDSVGVITARNGLNITSGSVGIGTDNPSQLLHLQADSAHQILLKRGGQYPSECKFSNSGNLLTISNNKNGIHFDVGSSSLATAMYIEDGGNIGIGTDNPSVLLHLADIEPQFYIQDSNSTGNNVNATLQFRDSSNSQLSYFGYAGASDSNLSLFNTMSGGALRLGTTGAERLRIRAEGPHLLIGTDGDATYNEITESSSNAGLVIGSSSMGNGGIVIRNSTSGTGRIYFADNSGSDPGRQRGQINYYHSGDYMMFATAGSERLRIDSGGRLLVGTTSLIDSSTASNFQIASSSGPRLCIARNNTNVTGGNLMGALDFYGNDSNGSYEICGRMLCEADGTHTTDVKPTRLAFYTTPTDEDTAYERLRITSAGKLTVTPADTTSSYATTDGGIDIAQTISSTGTSSSQSIGIQFSLTKSGQTGL